MVRIGAAAFDGVDRHGRINLDGSEMPGDSVEEQTGLEARAKAEAAESVVTTDYYTRCRKSVWAISRAVQYSQRPQQR